MLSTGEDAELAGPVDGVVAARDLKLAIHALHVRVHRVDADAEGFRDLLAAMPVRDEAQHGALADRQLLGSIVRVGPRRRVGHREVTEQTTGDAWADGRPALLDLSQGGLKLAQAQGLEQVAEAPALIAAYTAWSPS